MKKSLKKGKELVFFNSKHKMSYEIYGSHFTLDQVNMILNVDLSFNIGKSQKYNTTYDNAMWLLENGDQVESIDIHDKHLISRITVLLENKGKLTFSYKLKDWVSSIVNVYIGEDLVRFKMF